MTRKAWLGVLFSTVSVGVGCTALTQCGARVAAAGFDLTIRVDGGNAFVFTDKNKQVDIGAVRPPTEGAADFNQHPMRLILTRGVVEQTPDALRTQKDAAGRAFWPLAGYEIHICPGGKCPTTSALSTSPTRTPTARCNPARDTPRTDAPVDNLYYIPDLLELHPGSKLKADWRDRLESRLVLRDGRLTVVRAISCFTFDGSGHASGRAQSIADGDAGIRHELKVAPAFVDVVFRKPNATDVRVRVKPHPDEQAVTLHVATGNKGTEVKDGDPVPHFTPFYELLEPLTDRATLDRAAKKQPPLTLRFTPTQPMVEREVSPGGECPPGRFGGSSDEQ